MKTFFLHYGHTDTTVKQLGRGDRTTLPEPREFLDERKHDTAAIVHEISANSWIEARHDLPY